MIFALLGLAAVLLAIRCARKLRGLWSPAHPDRPPLPPGPTPLPLLGNVLGMNKDAPHLTYTAWSKTYGTCFAPLNTILVISMSTCDRRTGDVVYFRVLGQDFIVLNSEQAALALLEKRSQKYSDRPASIFSVAVLCVFPAFLRSSRSRVHKSSAVNGCPLTLGMGRGSGYTGGCYTKFFTSKHRWITVTNNCREPTSC